MIFFGDLRGYFKDFMIIQINRLINYCRFWSKRHIVCSTILANHARQIWQYGHACSSVLTKKIYWCSRQRTIGGSFRSAALWFRIVISFILTLCNLPSTAFRSIFTSGGFFLLRTIFCLEFALSQMKGLLECNKKNSLLESRPRLNINGNYMS